MLKIQKYLFLFRAKHYLLRYKGGGSAQGLAMHDIVKASKWQLALTGTIAAGYANNLFYLLYRLDPALMVKKGFEYGTTGERKFSELYGTIETEYEVDDGDGEYHSTSRGRMIGSPKCRPGISPLIYSEYLMEGAVFLCLSDMSEYLPELKEDVIFVSLEDEIAGEYRFVRKTIEKRMMQKNGRTLLGSYLQFSLSYSDKPYGRTPILCPLTGEIIAEPADLSYLIQDGKILNKERKLVELVSQELSENRNVFIYCNYTGAGEANIIHRLKDVLENNCMAAREKIAVLESSYPSAEKREEWVHKKAKEGIRVFLTNPRCVKTGLDFRFDYEGIPFNYPTVIFYQMDHDLFTIWQAAKRHYRLNQNEECRTYYLVSEMTIQPAAVSLVASKQVATLAIQGKFSSEGLCSMAQGVDARIKLAQAVAERSETQERGLKGMFDVLNASNNKKGSGREYEPMLTFYELTGMNCNDEYEFFVADYVTSNQNGQDIMDWLYGDDDYLEEEQAEEDQIEVVLTEEVQIEETLPIQEEEACTQESSLDEMEFLFEFVLGTQLLVCDQKIDVSQKQETVSMQRMGKRNRRNQKVIRGQRSVLGYFGM